MHTCLDSYNAPKAAGTLGDARWIKRAAAKILPATPGSRVKQSCDVIPSGSRGRSVGAI